MQTTIYRVLGGVLLTSAVLKSYAIITSQSVQDGMFSDPRLRLLTIEWEIVLGVWLLIGRVGALGWTVSLLTFAVFTLVSGVLGLAGAASCGCLGLMRVSPWWTFGFDLFAIASLVWVRPSWQTFRIHRTALLIPVLVAVALTGSLIVGFAGTHMGEGVRAKLRGDGVVVRQHEVEVGSGQAGEWREADVEVLNWSPQRMRVYGGTTGCNFDILADCPAQIEAGSGAKMRVRLRLPDEVGPTRQGVVFWATNEAGTAAWDIPVTLTGVVSGLSD